MQPPNPLDPSVPLVTWAHIEEIKLRGLSLTTATDADWIINMILNQLFIRNLNEVKTYFQYRNGQQKDITNLSFFEKIEICRQGLTKYHPTLFAQYEKTFLTIDTLRSRRNMFAHDKIDTSLCKQDKTELTISILRDNFVVESHNYPVKQLWDELHAYRKDLLDALNVLLGVMASLKLVKP